MRLNGPVMAILLAIAASSARAGCLEEVAAFAERICGQIQTSGSSTLTEANGKLKAEVSGIVRKAIGDAGGSIDVRRLGDAYENVLRQDLAKELFNVRECRTKMVEVGRSEACKASVVVDNGCKISGHVFDRDSHVAIVGALIDAYTFEPLTNIKASRVVASHIAISGPGGSFSGDCRGIAQSSFPLRLAIRRNSGGGTEFMPARVDFNDVQTEVNLPISIKQ